MDSIILNPSVLVEFLSVIKIKTSVPGTLTLKRGEDLIFSGEVQAGEHPVPVFYEGTYTINFNGQNKTVEVLQEKTYPIAYYKVVFDLNGGTLVSGSTDQRVPTGENAVPPEVSRSGYYDFAGWDGDYNNVNSDRTIKATWTYDPPTPSYKVTFDMNGGTYGNYGDTEYTRYITEGYNATPPPRPYNPPDSTYEFDGWDKSYTNIQGPKTIYAQWLKKLNGWVQSSDGWRYYRKGVMSVGWDNIDNERYHFGSDGIMTTGFYNEGGYTYYFASSGNMATGWVKLSDGYRFFESSTGHMEVDKWSIIFDYEAGHYYNYHFATDGILDTNTTIGGIRVDGDGRELGPDGKPVIYG